MDAILFQNYLKAETHSQPWMLRVDRVAGILGLNSHRSPWSVLQGSTVTLDAYLTNFAKLRLSKDFIRHPTHVHLRMSVDLGRSQHCLYLKYYLR